MSTIRGDSPSLRWYVVWEIDDIGEGDYIIPSLVLSALVDSSGGSCSTASRRTFTRMHRFTRVYCRIRERVDK
jgi:hypothetical protein